jgi:hypothetical protein
MKNTHQSLIDKLLEANKLSQVSCLVDCNASLEEKQKALARLVAFKMLLQSPTMLNNVLKSDECRVALIDICSRLKYHSRFSALKIHFSSLPVTAHLQLIN